ncbi:ATP-binding protein [Endozoicomonas sp. 8E]|uniref:ATP-binding protein n=1 Tax=Endozoicomonas sp. 8E TaxID=3035692 RepID=UPI0029391AB1|nr:DnaA/Hda family protein [Endozoicomonas sp. 8E]WOG28092.1 DnaA/Hda family protein [Endozoicomonas sp. 8E]
MDNVNTFANSYQPAVPLQYGKTETESSKISAENSPSLTTSGSTSRSVKPSPVKNGAEMNVADNPKERVDSSGQTQSLRKRIIEESNADASDTVVSAQGSKQCLSSCNAPVLRDDDATMAIHFKSLGVITPSYKAFPVSDSNKRMDEQFANKTIHWLEQLNTLYEERSSVMTSFYDPVPFMDASFTQSDNSLVKTTYDDSRAPEVLEVRKRLGVFYDEDYMNYELPRLSNGMNLVKHTLPEYFDRTYVNSFVAEDNGHTPSERLNAFFHGPTLADCATALLACQYRAIESIIGTDEFNRIFGAPVAKFRISCTISQSYYKFTNGAENLKPIEISNPIYNLFYNLSYLDETRIASADKELSKRDFKKGDIIYIAGVKDYSKKHKVGNATGFNLICTGQNSSGQNLYLGFGPDKFDEPKTYDQVKKILIDGYNKPQGPETIHAIGKGERHYAQLKGHILPHDHPIVGITCALRFSNRYWKYFLSQWDQVWHRRPLLPVTPTMEPKPVHQVSPFTIENLDSDFDQFKADSKQQKRMKGTALKFAHAVINNQCEASHKKPMGLFLSGSAGIGKTHLCTAVAKKAAEYGVDTLYIDDATAGTLYNDLEGNEALWAEKIDEKLAGKDLVVIDDANGSLSKKLLANTMSHVMTHNKAIMVSSNVHIPAKDATPGVIDPLTSEAHNFLYLSNLQGNSCRSQWWRSSEVQAADAISQLGQYQGGKAAAVITERTVSIDEMTKILSIPMEQIRRVGPPLLPGLPQKLSPDYFLSDLSKTQHQAVFMECDAAGGKIEIEQLINIVQRVHDEGLKLLVKTEDRSLLLKNVLNYLERDAYIKNYRLRIDDRLKHMFQDFSESGL